MKLLAAAAALLCAVYFSGVAGEKEVECRENDERGYLLLVPRYLNKNSTNQLHLSLYDVNAPGRVYVRLLKRHNNTIYTENFVHIDEGVSEKKIDLFVPDIEDYEVRFQISGTFDTEDDYKIYGETTVNFNYYKPASTIIFIQTDKPLYKPGQDVKFRILPVDTDLKPLGKEAVGDVWVETPSGSRVAQWKSVSMGNGIRQLEFPLANEPSLGIWTIIASVAGVQERQTFEVKEYVLPKFELKITPPPYVLADSETITIKVCAEYTYGEGVEGLLTLNISIETYSWSSEKVPHVVEEIKLNGCSKYLLNVSLVDPEFARYYRRIQVFAQVVEKGTGVSRNVTQYISRTQTPLYLAFENSFNSYFKPGLPYYGKVKVTYPDNTPAPDEEVSVCLTATRERSIGNWWSTRKTKYCRNYTSDVSGVIRYTVPPQYTDTANLELHAKSLKYLGTPQPPRPTLYAPETSTSLRSWYSPSGSHIQIQPIESDLPCGSRQKIQVLFTAKKSISYRLYYQIGNRGHLSKRRYVDVDFNLEDDISDWEWDGITDTRNQTQLLPEIRDKKRAEEEERSCSVLQDQQYLPYIGSTNIWLDVSSSLAPSFYLLIYYVRDDRETVADSLQISVEKCLPNKVSMKFAEEYVQPGTKTSFSVLASPNSLCGIRVIDKSVTLLDSTEQLTKDIVFGKIGGLDQGPHYPANHCNDKIQAGLPQSRLSFLPPRGSFSSYEDAVSAFEILGYSPISDLTLLTRPCQTSDYGGIYPVHRGYAAEASFDVESAPGMMSVRRKEASARVPVTESAVAVRTLFPETFLFDLAAVGEDGKLIRKEVLPHTITEWLGTAVCINQEDGLGLSDVAKVKGFQDFFLSFTLPYSVVRGEKLTVPVTVFNYLDKCLPVTVEFSRGAGFILLSKSERIDVCVCGGSSETVRFYIQPTTLGNLNLTVSGSSDKSTDVCDDNDIADSVARDALTNSLLVEPEGFPFEGVSSYFFFPQDYEDGTFRQQISYALPDDVVEDSERGYFSATGDIMGSAIENLNNLIRLPTGCGEQNIVAFAPNVYVLKYLIATGKLDDKTRDRALRNLQTGYQRQLQFRHYDYSYSTFGNADREGSIFLTAFVVRSFADAAKFISVDSGDLERSRDWIVSKQQPDGCFPMIGQVFTESLRGGVQTDSTESLSAYILMSLLSAGLSNDSVTDAALSCIEATKDVSPFQAALFAYTFALAGDEEKAERYLEELYRTADETGDTVFWHYPYLSVQLEIAAYAVLTNLELGNPLKDSIPIIRWMNSKRNGLGGFASTQDTVLGLDAFSKFAILLGKEPVDLEVSASGDLEQKISITSEDQLLLRTFRVAKVPGEVHVKATGTGGGLIQAIVRCNTNKPYKREFFSLDVKTSRKNCNVATINMCISYLLQGKKSNMAIVEVKMVSGMGPVKESLERLKDDPNVGVKRVDVENNNVILYFNELTNTEICFSFLTEQLWEVENLKAGTAKVYDYYATERTEETFYKVDECI